MKDSISEAQGNQCRDEKALSPPQGPPKNNFQRATLISKFILIFSLVFISFVVYFNSISGDFVYDDTIQIVDNPWIKDISNIPTIFSHSAWSFQTRILVSHYYRPLMHIVYMLNYHLFGLNPWGFHLVNVLFHSGVSVLVFLIMRRLLTEQSASLPPVSLSPPFFAAILFASHPIHTEAVSWIAGLPDVAFTFFYLLSFYFYILLRCGFKRVYLLSIFSFSLATLFKEPALTLPIMLIAYDYLVKRSDEAIFAAIKRYIPYVIVSGVYLAARYYALRGLPPMESYSDLSSYQLIINIFPLFGEYLTGMLWPFDLNFWHAFHPLSSLFEAKGIFSLVISVLFLSFALTAYRKDRLLFFSLLLIVVPLLPAFYIKAISWKPFAERYLYLPSVGFVFLLANLLSWARKKLPQTTIGITMVFIVLAGSYAIGTFNRNAVWQNSFNLWSDTVKKSPDSAEAHHNLGLAYKSRGLVENATAEFQTALRLQPDHAEAHNNLGIAYASQGQWDRAIIEFQTASQLIPDLAEAHFNLGIAYEYLGQWDRAIAEFQTTLQLKPDFYEARRHLNDIVSIER